MLRFAPILKRIRWGGRRLGEVLGKTLGVGEDFAESWEVADHGDDQSVVLSGAWRGETLQQVVRQHAGEVLGRHAAESGQFPLLVKFLDAHDRLSVQVHPDDVQAMHYTTFVDGRPRDRGKTEAWVILAADPGSVVYAGLKPGVDRERLRRGVQTGKVEDCLHRVEVRAGDVIFIPAGTVHAIGEGVLLAEVQQTSDLTFRLYDWGRVGSDGKPRPLHLDQALDCTDFTRGPVEPSVPRRLLELAHHAEELVRCDYFVMRRHRLDRAWSLPADQTCHILLVLAGEVAVRDARGAGAGVETLRLGETGLLPACELPAVVEPVGEATVLEVFLP